jgi:hypothetical protein
MYKYKVILKYLGETEFMLFSPLNLRDLQNELKTNQSVVLDNMLILEDSLIFIEQINK